MRTIFVLALWAPLGLATAHAQAPQRPAVGTDIAAATRNMDRRDGFIPAILDADQGRLLLELPRDSTRALLFSALASGLGSNTVGLDRGADGPSQVVRFERSGARVQVVVENWGFRSTDLTNAAHQRSVSEAFASSPVLALPLVAAEGGRLLVDATDLVFRDWMGVADALQRAQQAGYSLARDRSSLVSGRIRGYPRNTELEAALTFATSGRPGGIVGQVTADGAAFTVRQHVTLLALPDDGYRPREMDLRVGYFGLTFLDYARPIQRPLETRWIARHRLDRADPRDARSPVREPIVYYIDPGIPEPVRSATFEGAKFWEEAFAQAGLPGGFRVEWLPEGADPMDARYNVVQWVNRADRGWSIGGSLGDPRTGQIVKAMARMDSHRARTDYTIYAALMGADAAAADTAFVLARVRQVTAHEIGHTLGLAHNYIASTYERGSVMDYPPPRVRVGPDGELDISQAYARGPGPYDVWAIRWGYGVFPPESEADSLRAVVADGLRRGFLYLSDADARPDFASDPRTNLWDDAATPSEYLRHQMEVRRVAMQRFGPRNVRPGDPLATLQERFAFVYFWHRAAVLGLARSLGGLEYAPAVRGDGQQATRAVPAALQRAALSQLLGALEPAELAIPDTVLTLLGPRPSSLGSTPEQFASRSRPAFDALGAAHALADLIVAQLLQRERAARLAQQAALSPGQLTLAETIDSLLARAWRADAGPARDAALRRVVSRAITDRLLALAADREAAPEARAMAELKLGVARDRARLLARTGRDESRAHWVAVAGDATRWLERRELPQPTPAPRTPMYDPFGEP